MYLIKNLVLIHVEKVYIVQYICSLKFQTECVRSLTDPMVLLDSVTLFYNFRTDDVK